MQQEQVSREACFCGEMIKMTSLLATLNDDFALPGELEFGFGPGGFIVARITNELASAEVALYGGQVLAFQPAGEAPVLWLSPDSEFSDKRAVRGGIPLCWPWFGPHSTNASFPKHGFARLESWQVIGAERLADGETRLRLILPQLNTMLEWWQHPFELSVEITVGRELDVRLRAHNPGPEAFRITAALHSYFQVCDVETIAIEGLEGKIYLDQPAAGVPRLQEEEVTLRGEVDRVYLDTANSCTIIDPCLKRRIVVQKRGSRSTVVWNPGAELVQKIKDFTSSEWSKVVCLETANAASDSVEIPPGGEHVLGTTISVERF